MYLKLKLWFYTKILKRKYLIGFDPSNGEDYKCKTEGYIDKEGIIHIEKATYLK